MSRSEVAAKGWATRKAKLEAAEAARYAESVSHEMALAADTANDNAPGRGEIIGGAEYQLTEEICNLARKKGGKDAIQNLITNRIAQARADGEYLANKGNREVREQMQRLFEQQVVCAFMSEVDVLERSGDLRTYSPPWTISALTVLKIAKVLRSVGYTPQGMGTEPRT